MLNDFRYAIRMLLKRPGSILLVILSLVLGIAANTMIFSLVNALLFTPPPVRAPGELWQVWRQRDGKGPAMDRMHALSYPSYVVYRDQNQTFDSLAAYQDGAFLTWSRDGIGQSVQCQYVSGNYFQTCGISMEVGRSFDQSEDRQVGANPVAVLSHRFWKGSLASDAQIVGKVLSMNGVGLTVIGVAPEDFHGLLAGISPDLWVPFMMASSLQHDPAWYTQAGAFSLFGVGRLKRSVSPAQAAADLTVLTRRLESIDPKNHAGVSVCIEQASMTPTPLRGTVSGISAIMMGAVLMVLVIACANAANLLLARTLGRRREMAVRSSLGASRLRLIGQLLMESVILAMISGTAALLLTAWLVPALVNLVPPTLALRFEIAMHWNVILFTAAISLLMGLIFGLVPALNVTRLSPSSVLKEESNTAVAGRSRLANVLVVGQVAICLALLVCCALCLKSLVTAHRQRIGMEIDDRVMAEVNLKEIGYSAAQIEQFDSDFLQRVSALPNIESAAMADFLPLDSRSLGITFNVENHQPPSGQDGFSIQTFNVGPRFFETMGTRILKGREFRNIDRDGAPPVVVINRAMADRFWPGQDAIGRHLTRGSGPSLEVFEIIGVVETGKYRSLGESVRSVVFRSRLQERGARSTFVAHIRGDPAKAMLAFRDTARVIDAQITFSRMLTMDRFLLLALFPSKATGLLFGVLGGLAVVLAISGLFGVVAYSVSRRTREIGIRMAMGAQRKNVHRMVIRQGMALVIAGIILGLFAAFAGTRLLSGMLVGVSAGDPMSFISMPLLLSVVALAACWIPARRAARVDPMVALRSE